MKQVAWLQSTDHLNDLLIVETDKLKMSSKLSSEMDLDEQIEISCDAILGRMKRDELEKPKS